MGNWAILIEDSSITGKILDASGFNLDLVRDEDKLVEDEDEDEDEDGDTEERDSWKVIAGNMLVTSVSLLIDLFTLLNSELSLKS